MLLAMRDQRFVIGYFGDFIITCGLGMLMTIGALFLIHKYFNRLSPGVEAALLLGVIFTTVMADKWMFARLPRGVRFVGGLLGWLATFLALFLWIRTN